MRRYVTMYLSNKYRHMYMYYYCMMHILTAWMNIFLYYVLEFNWGFRFFIKYNSLDFLEIGLSVIIL